MKMCQEDLYLGITKELVELGIYSGSVVKTKI